MHAHQKPDVLVIQVSRLAIFPLVQISFLKIAYLGQHNEDGTMINLYWAEIESHFYSLTNGIKKRQEQRTLSPF